jgi:erythrocyte band 7 integral membrane protein
MSLPTNASVQEQEGISSDRHYAYETFVNSLGDCIGTLCTPPCCIANPYQLIQEGTLGIFLKFGRFEKIVKPGIYYVNPLTSTLIPVNVQLQVLTVRGQSIMTKDNVEINIESVVYYKIVDVYKATFGVMFIRQAVDELTHTTLRDALGRMTLQECIEHRNSLAEKVRETIAKPTYEWGIQIDNMVIREINLNDKLRENLSSAAQAKRLAESTIIAAQAEVDSAKLMRQASDILNSDAAMQIRYLETLATIARSPNTKIIFLPGEQPTQQSQNQIMYPQNAFSSDPSAPPAAFTPPKSTKTDRALNTVVKTAVLNTL